MQSSLPTIAIRSRFYLLRQMVLRDIRSRYADSLLGVGWIVLEPLSQILIYAFIFGVVVAGRSGDLGLRGNTTVWLVSGLLPWFFFSNILARSANSVLEHGQLVKKSIFPPEIGPVIHLASGVVYHAIAMGILLIGMGGFGIWPGLQVLWMLPVLLSLSLLALGLGWLFAAVTVYVRDFQQLLQIMLQFWFFMTPIVYPTTLLPNLHQRLTKLNPIYHAVSGYRSAFDPTVAIDIGGYLYLSTVAVVLFAFGWTVFRRRRHAFVDLL